MSGEPQTAAPANTFRGEVALFIDGIAHKLRPTFAALTAAEDELGSLFLVVERAAGGSLKLAEMIALFWHCLAARDDDSREEFAEAVTRAGLAACAGPLRALLVQVLKGVG